ncbi:MAG: hypothetical protein JNK09_05955 [Prolixibacteraceae bacterium]|nr:hypothetical protein [Prolixibacteraceae bacterium]
MKRLIYFLCLVFGALACKEVYELPPQAMLQASFINSKTKNAVSTSVTVWGVNQEFLWVKDSVLQKILLPLSSNDTTDFLVIFDDVVDTLTFFHQPVKKYDSMETGFYYEHKLDSIYYSNNRIDSIVIKDSLVTKKWNENIVLYLHPLSAGNN